MPAIRSLSVGLLVSVTFGTWAHAAPISWYGGQPSWPLWYANRILSDGSFHVSSSATNVASLSANPFAWWNHTSLTAYGSPSSAASLWNAPIPLAPASPASTPSATTFVDAFINFGNGPYAEASTLTTGNPQAWYTSPSVLSAFGGVPSAQQQSTFTQSVLADIQHTFQISGLNISLTTDPSVPALHTMSVVSGTTYPSNPDVVGITTVGANGYSFIDKLAYATTPDQLAWAVAHNLSHELMHALGVANHPDATGNYLDAATATWSMLIDPNTKFSPAAVQLLSQLLATAGTTPGTGSLPGAQLMKRLGVDGAQILETPVPEPSTIALWSLVSIGGLIVLRRRSNQLNV
jgi:hypothetical protein